MIVTGLSPTQGRGLDKAHTQGAEESLVSF